MRKVSLFSRDNETVSIPNNSTRKPFFKFYNPLVSLLHIATIVKDPSLGRKTEHCASKSHLTSMRLQTG